MNKYGGVTLSNILRFIFGPIVLLLAFTLLALLALIEEVHSWFGGKRIEKKISTCCKGCASDAFPGECVLPETEKNACSCHRDWMADREDYYDTSNIKKIDWPLERQKALLNRVKVDKETLI